MDINPAKLRVHAKMGNLPSSLSLEANDYSYPTEQSREGVHQELAEVNKRRHEVVNDRLVENVARTYNPWHNAQIEDLLTRPAKKLKMSRDGTNEEHSFELQTTIPDSPIVSQGATDQEEKTPGMSASVAVTAVSQLRNQNSASDGGSPLIIAAILEGIYNLAENCEYAQVDLILEIVTAMRRHQESSCVSKWACGIFHALTTKHSSNASLIGLVGIGALVNAMRHHEDSWLIQWRGCACLMGLAFQNPANQVDVRKAGGIGTVLTGMRQHEGSRIVQECGCGALCNLARTNSANKIKIVAEGGVSTILRAMAWHKECSIVQGSGCWALMNLAGHASGQLEIVARGGIGMILSAMREHLESVDVQRKGCDVVWNLALLGEDNATRIVWEGGIGAFLAAMKRHGRSTEVQEKGCCLLYLLANGSDGRIEIDKKCGDKTILTALREHPDNKIIQEKGSAALRRFWGLSETQG